MSSATHPLELKVLSALKGRGWCDFQELSKSSGLTADQLRRSIGWLSSKRLVEVQEVTRETFSVIHEPPELLLVRILKEKGDSTSLDELKASFATESEFSAAFGRAKNAGWVELDRSGGTQLVRLVDPSGPQGLEELLQDPSAGTAQPSQREMLDDLLRRGIVVREEKKDVKVRITPEGEKAALEPTGEYIERLTTELLATGRWRGSKLRPIDVAASAPRFYPGRRHPVHDFIREVRETYVSMGFTELEGENIQPAFWNFDALFIPQDHPGREMQDTFYVRGVSNKALGRRGVVARVAAVHENGWKTGSRGWGYNWNIEEARRLVLRTHNTVLTIRALSESRNKEKRVFAVGKVYRNESVDYKHLSEFHQMDGIMAGEGLTTRHLIGFLKEFYKKLGMEDVKLWPSYFPYTEPSLQVMGYSKVARGWIELGGSGVFRPEVTRPLGVELPVLAWGLGIERLILLRYGLDDLRDLYSNDISWLRGRREFAGSKY